MSDEGTAHHGYSASGSAHRPNYDAVLELIRCKAPGCGFRGDRTAFGAHLAELGLCRDCWGLGVIKIRRLASYDHDCATCGGTGRRARARRRRLTRRG
ncbi:hypothetical protein LO762_01790 [Actinocorallia sp. API 0066]|uniref:hypothetical protein n=1 Tax=Actinocorallia sp. API 0066 TaxID=2896846 RepID=UPI001E5C0F46|nr:hypothetical protein [Actinocorallia sp. API 0066]MCD0447931.1 hypothetical protein [Actinocorallia sp. API 0066]